MTRATRWLVPSDIGLSFVRDIKAKRRRKPGRIWWAPTPPKGLTVPGAYTRGIEDGTKLGAEAMVYLADTRVPEILGWIAADAIASCKQRSRSARTRWNRGAVVGFFGEVGRRAAFSVRIMRELRGATAELTQAVDTVDQRVQRIMRQKAPALGITTRKADVIAKKIVKVIPFAKFKKRQDAKRAEQGAVS